MTLLSRGPGQLLAAIMLVSVTVLTFTAGSDTASAHANLIDTTPEDDSSMSEEPGEVSLTFNQNIGTPAYVVVTAPDGSRIESGDPEVVDEKVTEAVDKSGFAGTYKVSYRVISADGHPVSGTFTYEVTDGDEPATASDDTSSSSQSFVKRHRTALAIGLGGIIVAALLLFWPRRKKDV